MLLPCLCPCEAGLAFHAGHSIPEFVSWSIGKVGQDPDDCLGPWAAVVVFATWRSTLATKHPSNQGTFG